MAGSIVDLAEHRVVTAGLAECCEVVGVGVAICADLEDDMLAVAAAGTPDRLPVVIPPMLATIKTQPTTKS